MRVADKTKEQLINELVEMRQRIAELEVLDAERKQMEEKLKEARDEYLTITNLTGDIIVRVDTEGRWTFLNDGACQFWGKPREELMGIAFADYLHPDDQEETMAAVQKVQNGEAVMGLVNRQTTPLGWRTVEWNGAGIFSRNGRFIGFQATGRDITESKQAEEALRESEERFRYLLSTSPSVIYSLCLQGKTVKIAFVSENIKNILGYEQEEVRDFQFWQTLIHPDDLPSLMTQISIMLERKAAAVLEYRIKHKDGTYKWLRDTNRPIFDDKDQLVEVIGSWIDITERKKMEEALRESEEKFRTFMETASDLMHIADKDANFTYVNESMARALGYSKEEMIGMHITKILSKQTLADFKSKLEELMREGEFTYEPVWITKEGKEIHGELKVVAIFDRNGEFTGTRGVFRDITERKYMQEARIAQAAALAKAEEIKQSRQRIVTVQESLRSDIAQQIHGAVQNKLIVLMHRLSDLQNKPLSEQTTEEIANIHQKLEELLENNIRPISHRLYPFILLRGLVPALQSLADQFQVVSTTIELEPDEEIKRQERENPKFISERAKLTIYRIAEEALTNATKHAKASRITVKLGLSSEEWLRLMVRDDGHGYDMGSVTTGLGIQIMQDYAKVMGGSCVINSTLGKGTEVMAVVPIL